MLAKSCAGDADSKLVSVLGRHAGKLQWVTSMFQPRISQAATLLPFLLEGHGLDAPAHTDAGMKHNSTNKSAACVSKSRW